MPISFRSFLAGRLQAPGLLLIFAALFSFGAVACGSDDGPSASDAGTAESFEVSGDTLSWVPNWNAGESRTVNVTASFELNDAAQDLVESSGDGGFSGLPTEQSSSAATVTILSADSSGATAELDFNIEDLLSQFQELSAQSDELADSDLTQMSAMLVFAQNLDLGIEFGVDDNGAITGVTNLPELAATLNEFLNTLAQLATLGGDDTGAMTELADIQSKVTELFATDSAEFAVNALASISTANLFLMRSGVYPMGEPVTVDGKLPTAFGLMTDGTATYELTGIANGVATVQVDVAPGEIDLLAVMQQMALEIGELMGEDASSITSEFDDFSAEDQQMLDAVESILYSPYSATLTIDTSTGWVTGAEWSVELAVPEGSADLFASDDPELADVDLAALSGTLHVNATFE